MEETLDELWQKISQMSDAEVDVELEKLSISKEDVHDAIERAELLIKRKLEKKDGTG